MKQKEVMSILYAAVAGLLLCKFLQKVAMREGYRKCSRQCGK